VHVNIRKYLPRPTQVDVQIFPHNSNTHKKQGKRNFLFSKTCIAHINPMYAFTNYLCLWTPI